jgi:hypothetical protein
MSKCKCHSDLVKAKAKLEYLKALPTSAFQTIYMNGGGIFKHAVDVHSDAVQMARAKVKRLEVLAADTTN